MAATGITIVAALLILAASGRAQQAGAGGLTDQTPESNRPAHLPPVLFGRPAAVMATSLELQPLARANVTGVHVQLHPYTRIYRIQPLDPTSLQLGDSVLVQGEVDKAARIFASRRLIRTASRARLAPGVTLAPSGTSVPEGMIGASPADRNAAPPGEGAAPGQGSPSAVPPPNSPPAAVAPAAVAPARPGVPAGPTTLRPKQAARAELAIDRALSQGLLTGIVVSANPLVVQLYDGQLWRVSLDADTRSLDQVKGTRQDLEAGRLMQVKGSEIGPNLYRASEINVLGPGLQPGDLDGRPLRRRR